MGAPLGPIVHTMQLYSYRDPLGMPQLKLPRDPHVRHHRAAECMECHFRHGLDLVHVLSPWAPRGAVV